MNQITKFHKQIILGLTIFLFWSNFNSCQHKQTIKLKDKQLLNLPSNLFNLQKTYYDSMFNLTINKILIIEKKYDSQSLTLKDLKNELNCE